MSASLSSWLTPKRLLTVSVVVALVTIVLKTLAWWITDSVGLLSDAMESLVNLASAVFGLVMVTIAARPADDDHPYGHHKAEYFSSGFEGVLIIVAALGIIWAAVGRFLAPQPLEQIGWGLVLSIVSSALNGLLAWAMFRASREHRSIALEGDARHLITDVWTSAGVVVGIALVHFTGWLWLDPVVAIGVALNILKEGGHLIWRSSQGLMDEALEPEVQATIDQTLAGFAHQRNGTAIIRFDHVSTRKAGQRRYVDLHMHMPASWTLGRAAALRISVEQALMSAVPGLRASIQLLPSDVEAHFFDEVDLEVMLALLQRVRQARVDIAGETVGQIGAGLLVLVCAEPDDTEAMGQKLLAKILKLRIFSDEAGKMNRSVQDVGGGLLIVSQFTLAADTKGGNRPGFTGAAPPSLGEVLYDRFVALAREQHPVVQTGRFGADMQVHLTNDGPVTIPMRMA